MHNILVWQEVSLRLAKLKVGGETMVALKWNGERNKLHNTVAAQVAHKFVTHSIYLQKSEALGSIFAV